MKKIVCDNCRSENAKTYRYSVSREMDPSGNGYNSQTKHVDLCVNCLQDFVLKHQVKLAEVSDGNSSNGKKIIHG